MELLVVIAIIAILTGIVVFATRTPRDQAKVTKMTNDVRNIVIALAYELKEQGRQDWWTETELGLGVDPYVGDIIDPSGPLKNIPEPLISGVSQYLYDNDGDTLSDNEADEKGVNILLKFNKDSVRDRYFDMFDSKLEYGNGASVGKLRKAPGSIILFNISSD